MNSAFARIQNTGNGAITVNADSVSLDTVNGATISAGTGSLTIANRSAGTLVNVGGAGTDVPGANGTRKLDINTAELGRLTAGTLTLGATNAGDGTISSAITWNTNLALISGGNINVSGTYSKTAGADATLTLTAANSLSTGADISSTVGKLGMNFTASTGAVASTASTFGRWAANGGDITVTSATAGNITGAVSAANFTKSGASALALSSWSQTTPVQSAVTNSYTVNGGSLTLNTGSSFFHITPAFVNINNGSTFSSGTGNGMWSTVFNFDANGGGTLSLVGNAVLRSASNVTFKTNGGATNTVNGWLNLNSSTGSVTLDVANAAVASNPGLLFGTGTGLTNSAVTPVTKTGIGLVRFNNALTTNRLNVQQGTVEFGDGTSAAGSLNVANVDIASGAILSFNIPSAVSANYGSAKFTGSGTMVKKGAGTVYWGAGAANFQLSAGGLIDVQAGTFLGSNNANEVWTNNQGSLNVASGALFGGSEGAVRVDGLTGAGTVTLGFNPASFPNAGLTMGVAGNARGTSTFSGLISNNSGNPAKIAKVGSGTQILTGANNYTGTTTVTGGTLVVGNGTSGRIGTGAITIDGANTTLQFVNPASTLINLTTTQTVTGNGTIIADKAIAFGGTITINKSAVDGHSNLSLKTTAVDNTLAGGGYGININNTVQQAGTDNVSLTVDSFSSVYANTTGSIGLSGASYGRLDVNMTARGNVTSGLTVNSYGLSLSKMINANGGVATLTGTAGNTNSGAGSGSYGAVLFTNGSGISAESFNVTGTQTAGNSATFRAGIYTSGTTNFTITGSGTGSLSGTSNNNSAGNYGGVGLYTTGTINLNSGTSGGQIVMAGNNSALSSMGSRSEAAINTRGTVTLGSSASGFMHRQGNVTAVTGTLNLLGSTFGAYNNQAQIYGSDGTVINLSSPVVSWGQTAAAAEGGPTIGLATGATGYTLNISADNLTINTATGGTNYAPMTSINSGTGTTTIRNFSAGTSINVGGADVVAVGSAPATLGLTNTELNTITAARTVIGSSTAGNLTVSTATTSNAATGHLTLMTGGNMAIQGALNVGSRNLTLDGRGANSTISQTAALTASGLELLGTNASFDLRHASNDVVTLAGSSQSVSFSQNKALILNTVNATVGMMTSGDINLSATTPSLSSSGLWVMQAVKTTGGNITLSGSNTASTGSAVAAYGVRMGSTVGDANSGTITVQGTSVLDVGFFLSAAGSLQSAKPISLTGAGTTGANIYGSVTSLAGGSNLAGSNAIGISGRSNNGGNGVALVGAIQNNATLGQTFIESTSGALYLSGSITSSATAGDVLLSAGDGTSTSSAAVNATASATITQNANASVYLSSDGQGNVTPARIIKNGAGAGDVVIAAGKLLAAGNGAGGQVTPLSGNTISNSGTGNC